MENVFAIGDRKSQQSLAVLESAKTMALWLLRASVPWYHVLFPLSIPGAVILCGLDDYRLMTASNWWQPKKQITLTTGRKLPLLWTASGHGNTHLFVSIYGTHDIIGKYFRSVRFLCSPHSRFSPGCSHGYGHIRRSSPSTSLCRIVARSDYCTML